MNINVTTHAQAFERFNIEHVLSMGEKPTAENLKEYGLDSTSMELLADLPQAWIVKYHEGGLSPSFINVVFKDKRNMETIEL